MISNTLGYRLAKLMPGVETITLRTRRATEPAFAARQSTASTTDGSPVVTGLSTTSLYVGQAVTSPSLPAPSKRATILSIDSASQVTLSANAIETLSGTGQFDFTDAGCLLRARRKPVALQMLILAEAQLSDSWLTFQGYAPPGHLVGAPTLATPTLAAGGTLTAETPYYYVITALTANGESVQSEQQTITPAGSNSTVALVWEVMYWATGYKIYRSTTSGVYGASSLLATINSPAILTYSDLGAATAAGQPPATSTATITPPRAEDEVVDQDGLKYKVNKRDGKLLLSVYDLLCIGDR